MVVPTDADTPAATDVVDALATVTPALQVRLGGPGAAAVDRHGLDLGDDLVAAARIVAS